MATVALKTQTRSLGRGAFGVVRGGDRLRTRIARAAAKQLRNYHNVHKMSTAAMASLRVEDEHEDELSRMNKELASLESDPLKVLKWSMDAFDGRLAMSTSFGIQSAVLLHLATRVKPDIPVVWVDTGYLPKETYEYAEVLRETLNLNLRIASNQQWSPARMEALHGKLWENEDAESHSLYGKIRKVEPMAAGLAALDPNPLALLSGLRASQTKTRANMSPIGFQQGRFKLLPLLRMTDEDVAEYMDHFDLPRHPLEAQGYMTVGDWHSSRPVQAGEDPRNTRFGGRFQECGLHADEAASSPSSTPSFKPVSAGKPQVLEPASLEATGVKALGLTRTHSETDIAVIMVKKRVEDGSFCRKCNDVAGKIEADHLSDWIGYTAVADVLEPASEGVKLAKHFDVATAPFFLIRDVEAEKANSEWRVVRSYLQLRKILEKAADHKLATKEAEDPVVHEKAEHDPELLGSKQKLDRLQVDIAKLQLDLRDRQNQLADIQKDIKLRSEKLGLL